MNRYRFERISLDAAKALLKKGGLDVSDKEAKDILDLLYILAILEIEQALKKNDSRSIRKGEH